MPHVDVVTGRIRNFLLQNPKPTHIRLVSEDGLTDDIQVGKQPFVRLAESIIAVSPEMVQCLDKNKNLIRAMSLHDQEARRSDAAEIPEGLKADPTALMLTHFANLLHRAYEHSTEIAFDKLVELVDRIDARSENTERRLEALEEEHRDTLREQAETELERAREEAAGAGGATGLIGSFMQGAMAGNHERKANGKD